MKKIAFIVIASVFFFTSCEKDIIPDSSKKIDFEKKGERPSHNIQLPANLPNDFIWGINGHPTVADGEAYHGNENQDFQINLLQRHQIEYYRINFKVNQNGSFEDSNDAIRFASLKNKIFQVNQNGGNIKLLPVVQVWNHIDFNLSENDNYENGKALAVGFNIVTEDYFDIFSLGNEIVLREGVLLPTTPIGNGTEASHYDLIKLDKIAAFLKGMNDGFKIGTGTSLPVKKTMIVTTRRKFYFIRHMIKEGVGFDIIGYHFYANINGPFLTTPLSNPSGTIIDSLEAFSPKNVWITEINRTDGSAGLSEEEEQREIINIFIRELNNTTNIKAFFLYELLDSYHLGNSPEANYGIIDFSGSLSNFSYKLASETYKFRIEEITNGYEDYIYSLYSNINLREPYENEDGFNNWVIELNSTHDISYAIRTIMHDEGYYRFAEYQMEDLINRGNYIADIKVLEEQLQNHILIREDVIRILCSSNAFWNLSNNNYVGFIERAINKLLYRDAYSSELTDYLNLLNNGASRESIIVQIMNSEEYLRKFIRKQFIDLLDRESNIEAENYWYNKMANEGLSQESLIKDFLRVQEYWNRAIIEGYERRTGFNYYF